MLSADGNMVRARQKRNAASDDRPTDRPTEARSGHRSGRGPDIAETTDCQLH